MSSIVNKIKDAVNPDRTTHAEGAHGPHNSRVANAADPRVDSDRDGSRTAGTTGPAHHTGYTANEGYTTGGTGTTGGMFSGSTNNNNHHSGPGFMGTSGPGPAPNTAGPHNSNALNKLDPRVDSDRDGSKTAGGPTTGGTTTTGTRGMGGMGGAGIGQHHQPQQHGIVGGTTGHHNASAAPGFSHGTGAFTGNSGPGPAPNTAGPHRHDAANKLDPRVDSVSGPGPAPNTAGPHKSDLLNKLDPRVDSDMDGSKTLGNTTGTAANNTTAGGRFQ